MQSCGLHLARAFAHPKPARVPSARRSVVLPPPSVRGHHGNVVSPAAACGGQGSIATALRVHPHACTRPSAGAVRVQEEEQGASWKSERRMAMHRCKLDICGGAEHVPRQVEFSGVPGQQRGSGASWQLCAKGKRTGEESQGARERATIGVGAAHTPPRAAGEEQDHSRSSPQGATRAGSSSGARTRPLAAKRPRASTAQACPSTAAQHTPLAGGFAHNQAGHACRLAACTHAKAGFPVPQPAVR